MSPECCYNNSYVGCQFCKSNNESRLDMLKVDLKIEIIINFIILFNFHQPPSSRAGSKQHPTRYSLVQYTWGVLLIYLCQHPPKPSQLPYPYINTWLLLPTYMWYTKLWNMIFRNHKFSPLFSCYTAVNIVSLLKIIELFKWYWITTTIALVRMFMHILL